ncbi:MAG TPA: hypothetical protein PK055_00120 [Gammaproteobacteria bacterium]|nr:hypothetical protein [Xanthomonadales bacterium]MCB1594046.1 hypothetical protein [Xanthomonadales bacterium]HOP21642.1 hypothetical protein [Gammaproteobacteria bacterium]HPI94592.1 hypothetical protein [Gammaproteobacteria bacterium]HPQ86037.1 hypothetical protein [Gammaproteobacteria bacterium]
MKNLILIGGLLVSTFSFSQINEPFHKEVIKCGKNGCEVVCNEPGQRWATYLESKGDIEVTYFNNGTRQLKADVGNGEYTILDTNPSYQTCRITGVAK